MNRTPEGWTVDIDQSGDRSYVHPNGCKVRRTHGTARNWSLTFPGNWRWHDFHKLRDAAEFAVRHFDTFAHKGI